MFSIRWMGIGVGVLLSSGCGGGGAEVPPHAGPEIIVASAPHAFSVDHLGRPHSADFELLSGKSSRLLVDKQNLRRSEQNRLVHDVIEVRDQESFAAHASGWGMVGAKSTFKTGHRYFDRHLVLIQEVIELDESDGLKEAPAEAVYYPWRVHMGWSYDVICNGLSSKFEADFRQRFLALSGEVSKSRETQHLDCSAVGHGIRFDHKKAIFARTLEQIERGFQSSNPVPVLVEWRRIPGRRGYAQNELELQAGCAGLQGCEPCEEWSYTRLRWQIPERKTDGSAWDGDNSAPEVQVTVREGADVLLSSAPQSTYSFTWTFPEPLRVRTETELQFVVVDKDFMEDDLITQQKLRIPTHHNDSETLVFAGGQARLEGECLHR